MEAWLYGSVAGFYLLIVAATILLRRSQLPPRLLRWIHLGGWGFVVLQLGLMAVGSVSLRGQWLDVLPFGLTWLGAGCYLLLSRNQLSRTGKIYFGSCFSYPAVLAAALMIDGVFFALVSGPVFILVPSQEFYSGPDCAIRSTDGGLLSAKRFSLITPLGPLLEKHQGSVSVDEIQLDSLGTITGAQILPAPQLGTRIVLLTGTDGHQQVHFPND